MKVAEAIAGSGVDASEARLLLSSASGLARSALIAHPQGELSQAAADAFLRIAERRRRGEPIAYLLGKREFYTLSLTVTPDVLIPRPETELLVDFALERLPKGGSVLDLGTGSGAIALAVKQQRPDAVVTAVERSPAALAVARANAVRHALAVEFLQGSWFAPMEDRRFDMIVSNPPYVAEGDPHLAEGDVRFEPRGALIGGPDGLADIRCMVDDVARHLLRGGWLAIEHGAGQDGEVRALIRKSGLESVSSRPDLAGIARISVGQYNPE